MPTDAFAGITDNRLNHIRNGHKPNDHTILIYDQSDGYYTDDKRSATFPDSIPLWGAFGIPEGTPLPSESL